MAAGEATDGRELAGSGRNQSLARAFALLECLAAHSGGASVATLSRELRLPRATVTRLLGSLADLGAVSRAESGRAWRLGPAIARLGRAAGQPDGLADLARPLLVEASGALRETVFLGVPAGRLAAQVVAEVPGPSVVGVGSWLGRTLSSPASGFVRMLLAELAPDEAERALAGLPLRAHTPTTITDPERLLAEVRRVRDEDACVVVDEFEIGLAGLAVPVRRDGRLVAMVGMYLPTARLTDRLRTDAIRVLREVAGRLERVAGG
jgi:DNA-binding IclR family transcriptional regulator